MHHALRQLFVMLIALVALTIEARAQSKILRDECLNFPKMPEISKMVRGVHFTIQEDMDCDDDYDHCTYWAKVEVNYRYDTIRNFDHYTREGKLITSSQEKSATKIEQRELESTGGSWTYQNGEKLPSTEAGWAQVNKLILKAQTEIEKKIALEIYNSAYGACKDSHYKQ